MIFVLSEAKDPLRDNEGDPSLSLRIWREECK